MPNSSKRTPRLAPFLLSMLLASSWPNRNTAAEPLTYSPPAFDDPERQQKIEAVLPEVDRLFSSCFETNRLPGLIYGVILDGKLIRSCAFGFSDLDHKTPVSHDTAFRIASMTKSFVSLATFKLRDEGRLSLDDPVAKYVPQFRKVRLPTSDSCQVTIRNLMTMTTGLPEDNPWGDRQLAISKPALKKFIRQGLSFSNPPGQQYEYSNLGYVLLGQVVSKVSGVPFQQYITDKILRPLGMNNTRWEFGQVPPNKLALGYRWENDTWKLEPMLHDGEGAACGGLLTTLDDFAKYVRFHLDAGPARDGADSGPIRRGTLREMHKPFIYTGSSPAQTLLDGVTPNPAVSFYGYGLGWSIDARQVITLAHTGGLPGFGSHYRFLPDYGLAVIAFANRTYAPVSRVCAEAINLLLERGHLHPRSPRASAVLQTRAEEVRALVTDWDTKLGDRILAENFFLDKSRADRMKAAQETLRKAGAIKSVGPLVPENQLRGTFTLLGEKGRVNVHFTLTPESIPKVQALKLEFVPGT